MLGPFSHAGESQPFAALRRGPRGGEIESPAIVADSERDEAGPALDDDCGFGGGGVLDHIVDGILHDPINVDFRIFVKYAVNVLHPVGEENGPGFGSKAYRRADRLRQTQPVQLVGPQAVRNLSHLLDGLGTGGGSAVITMEPKAGN